MARKKRKTKSKQDTPPWKQEDQNEIKTLRQSTEERDRRWREFDHVGHALIRYHNFNNLVEQVDGLEEIFKTELLWHHQKLVSENELETSWYCHLVRENILKQVLSPILKQTLLNDFTEAKELLIQKPQVTEEDKQTVSMLFMCSVALQSENMLFEHSSYFRGLLRRLREHCCNSDDWKGELKESLEVFEAYEALEDKSPYLAWVFSKYEGNPPDPHYRDDESHMRMVGLIGALEGHRLQVSLFREEELAELLQQMTEDNDNNTEAMQHEPHCFNIEQWKQSREFLWSIRQTPRWEQIRSSIEISASKYLLSGRSEFRIWAQHLKEWAQTLDDYHRGEHPTMKAALNQELAAFFGEPEQQT